MSLPASNGKTVLLTGINGYIASVLGQLLLSKGYSLRGTTRRKASADSLISGPYAPYAERVRVFEIPDVTIEGAFDEAATGVDGIFHTASPISLSLTEYDQVIVPAVRGIETLLASALLAGSQLKSVVITSSVAAIINPPPEDDPSHEYTEEEYGTVALDAANKDRDEGRKSDPGVLYYASKIAADRKTWAFREDLKPSFAISSVNPSFVIGPPVYLPSSDKDLNLTLRPIYDVLSGALGTVPANLGSGSFVDVRDVALIHLWALENPSKADGQRYIANGGFGPYQAAADVLHLKYKGQDIAKKIPIGERGEGYIGYNKETGVVEKVDYLPNRPKLNGSKAATATGLDYISFQKSVEDSAVVLEKLL